MMRATTRKQKRLPRKAFREMDLGLIGLVGLVVTLVVLASALNIGKLLDVFGQTSYTADLTETGGLRTGDDVRIAGIAVGKVKDVELAEDRVVVTFGIENVELGDRTLAYVKADNALGSKYLAIEPSGDGDVDHIPLERTDPGFAVSEELGELTRATGEIDAKLLAESMESVSQVLSRSPKEFRGALRGVSLLSQTISSRDADLNRLLERASSVSELLSNRSEEITAILTDGSRLFRELHTRREIIGRLLRNVQHATEQMQGLVRDNQDSLKPALTELLSTAELLTEYRDTLDFAIKNIGVYARSLGEGVGSGPFFQAYLANLASPEDLITGGVEGIIQQQIGGR